MFLSKPRLLSLLLISMFSLICACGSEGSGGDDFDDNNDDDQQESDGDLEDESEYSETDGDFELDKDTENSEADVTENDLSEDGDNDKDGDYETDSNPDSSEFNYNFQYDIEEPAANKANAATEQKPPSFRYGVHATAHAEPEPPGYYTLSSSKDNREDLVIPAYADDMPPFERGFGWDKERCYELSNGAEYLSEAEAFDLYAEIVEKTLWYKLNEKPGQRTVVGLRGTYPGTFAWHGNLPTRFNDTLALLWVDEQNKKHIREFPVNTDTGAHDFGVDSSSSLYPNRRYPYDNGWHRNYNALTINLWGYMVRDDTNNNGHWDSDRNGWLPPYYGEDRYREGSAHNIHVASVNGPLNTAAIENWSAGCQTIPGMENWLEFISNAWTQEGNSLDYFLIDARDISPDVWQQCPEELGTHACPYKITSLPYTHSGDTSQSSEDLFDYYNCSEANESGPEVVYVLNIRDEGTLNVSVEVEDEDAYDPDVHLLEGDDEEACRNRDHKEFSETVWPGRYVIIVDTFVDSLGSDFSGPYTLTVSLDK